MNHTHTNLISQYITAKDNNKPHLMKCVFSAQARLEMIIKTDNISFPAQVTGVDKITQTLVREFNSTYENIYTLCLTDTLHQNQDHVNCRWVVCMTEKTSGSLRVGYGDYRWSFEKTAPCLANHLLITIENMIVLPCELQPELQTEILAYFGSLPYPWVLSSELQATMPDITLLTDTLLPLYS